MQHQVIFQDLGLTGYAVAWDIQKKLLAEVQEFKQSDHDLPVCEQIGNYNYLLFCEHPHVFTLGKSGNDSNLLVNEDFLQQKGATFFKTDRGGDITYHGPGQIVGYPIFDLEAFGMGVKEYVHSIEETVIRTLGDFNINAGRLKGATGVWLNTDNPANTRKICAIGVRVSRYVTMHGFAFNVNPDLSYYDYINPCGFTDKGVTSMEKELGRKLNIEEVKEKLKAQFASVFGFTFAQIMGR